LVDPPLPTLICFPRVVLPPPSSSRTLSLPCSSSRVSSSSSSSSRWKFPPSGGRICSGAARSAVMVSGQS
jgi:hypothetical protein